MELFPLGGLNHPWWTLTLGLHPSATTEHQPLLRPIQLTRTQPGCEHPWRTQHPGPRGEGGHSRGRGGPRGVGKLPTPRTGSLLSVSTLLLTGCVTLGQGPNLSVFQMPHLQNGEIIQSTRK